MTVTVERLKELLQYDPETGLWKWIKKRGAAAKAYRDAAYKFHGEFARYE